MHTQNLQTPFRWKFGRMDYSCDDRPTRKDTSSWDKKHLLPLCFPAILETEFEPLEVTTWQDVLTYCQRVQSISDRRCKSLNPSVNLFISPTGVGTVIIIEGIVRSWLTENQGLHWVVFLTYWLPHQCKEISSVDSVGHLQWKNLSMINSSVILLLKLAIPSLQFLALITTLSLKLTLMNGILPWSIRLVCSL